MAFCAPTGVPRAASDQLRDQMIKVYQWRMNTKLEAESKDNRLQIAEQTILSQNFELGQLRAQNETVSRNFMLKCEELAQAEKDIEFKEWQTDLVGKAIEIVADRLEKQEVAVDLAKKLDETHSDAVVELTSRYVKLKDQLDCLEKARKQVDSEIEDLKKLINCKDKEIKKTSDKIVNQKIRLNCKDWEIERLERTHQQLLQEYKELTEARSIDYDTELRKKNSLIQNLEAEMSKIKLEHRVEIENMEERNKAERENLEEKNKAMTDNLKKCLLSKDKENEELEKKMRKAQENEELEKKMRKAQENEEREKKIRKAQESEELEKKMRKADKIKKAEAPMPKRRSWDTMGHGPTGMPMGPMGSLRAKSPAIEPLKRKLLSSDLSSDDEGKLFEDFFSKPKKTYASKTPVKRQFFKRKGQPFM